MNTPEHAKRAHALLSASASARWLACTPSARLESEMPDAGSAFASEGTLAHEFAELYLRAELDGDAEPDPLAVAGLRGEDQYQSEMEEHAKEYAAYVREKISTSDAVVDVETRLDFSRYVPDGFGTGDCVICQEGTLTVVDFKYGRGVKVDAADNPQMKLYALGAIDAYDFAYDFDRIELCIYQPRLDNISEWTTDRATLERWAEETLRPRAKLAAEGRGEFVAGAHCRFCKIRCSCRALAEYCSAVVRDDFKDESGELNPALLTDDDYSDVLSRLEIITDWIRAVKDAALARLMNDPESVPGFKLVEGRSVRQYRDAAGIASALEAAGYTAEQFHRPSELLGITEMTKMLGRKRFNELLGGMVVKPRGKPTIVPISDPRPVFTPERAENDFEKEND